MKKNLNDCKLTHQFCQYTNSLDRKAFEVQILCMYVNGIHQMLSLLSKPYFIYSKKVRKTN